MSYIPDLKQSEWWHVLDLGYSRSIPEKFDAIMVGWLKDRIPSFGDVSSEIIEKLEWAAENRVIDQGWLGEHDCEICHAYTDRAEILIIAADKLYVAPKMIVHYISAHGYCPPQEFLDAADKIDFQK
jgi:hypothetical protein